LKIILDHSRIQKIYDTYRNPKHQTDAVSVNNFFSRGGVRVRYKCQFLYISDQNLVIISKLEQALLYFVSIKNSVTHSRVTERSQKTLKLSSPVVY
jgi:hypothetical protein